MKKLIYILTFLLSGVAFGQASSYADFSFTIKFEKDIPIEEIEVSYYVARNNSFTKINYKLNSSENEIELFGQNHFVVSAGFPVIVFSHKGKKFFETSFGETNKEEREVQNIFYLIIKKDCISKDYDYFDKELKFSKEKPNIIVSYKNNGGKINWRVSNEPSYFLPVYEMQISNELVKVKPIEE